jgi:hypothetical protein
VLGGEEAEGEQRLAIAGHAVVVGVPAQDAGEPASLFWWPDPLSSVRPL